MNSRRIAGGITRTIQVKSEQNGETPEHWFYWCGKKASFTCRTRLLFGRGKRKGNWQMRLSVLKKIRLFFIKKGLTISRLGDILLFRSVGSCNAGPAVGLISSVISAKLCVNLPSSICSFAPEKECQHRKIVSSCLAGRFSVVSGAGFLAGPSHNAYGKRPAFFVPGRCLVRRNDTLPPRSPCFCSIAPTVIKSIQPEIRSSGRSRHIPSSDSRKRPNAFLPRFTFLFHENPQILFQQRLLSIRVPMWLYAMASCSLTTNVRRFVRI